MDEDLLTEIKGIKSQIFYERNPRHLNNKLHLINDILIPFGYFLTVYTIQKRFRYLDLGNEESVKRKSELTMCAHSQFNGMFTVRAIHHNSPQKDILPVYIFIDYYSPLLSFISTIFISVSPKTAFIAHYHLPNKIQRRETYQCHYCHNFYKQGKKFHRHIKQCTGHPGFIYTFQDDHLETYENYLKHKKDFPFTVVGDLETTIGYISEMEGSSMFATSSCLIFNFHPKLKMTPITCLRSFGQTEEELKHISIPEKFWPYVSKGDHLECFIDGCESVLLKEKKQAISTLCMIEMWMVYQCLKNYFESVVKPKNFELTEGEKEAFKTFAEFNSYDRKAIHCEFPLDCKQLNPIDKDLRDCSRLDFVIKTEYQFIKNILTLGEITESSHSSSLANYYNAMTYLLKAYEFVRKQADYCYFRSKHAE